MTDFFRFPHTPHIAWLATGAPRDDKVLSPDEAHELLAGEVVLEEKLDGANLGFSVSPDGVLPETVERPDHPWFIGVQYHPELKSRPFAPHPLFASFIGAAVVQSRLV